MTLVLRYAARSDRGLIRGNNQDSVYAGPRLLAVADGMGGHAAGDVASKVVIAALEHLDDDAPSGDMLQSMRRGRLRGQRAPARGHPRVPAARGHGDDAHRDPLRRRPARAVPRRRLPRLPAARRRVLPDHPRRHVRADADRRRPDHAGGGQQPPAALAAAARPERPGRRPRPLHARGPRRRPLPALLRRAVRRGQRGDPRRGADRPRPADHRRPAHRAGAAQRRPRQHHRDRRRRRRRRRPRWRLMEPVVDGAAGGNVGQRQVDATLRGRAARPWPIRAPPPPPPTHRRRAVAPPPAAARCDSLLGGGALLAVLVAGAIGTYVWALQHWFVGVEGTGRDGAGRRLPRPGRLGRRLRPLRGRPRHRPARSPTSRRRPATGSAAASPPTTSDDAARILDRAARPAPARLPHAPRTSEPAAGRRRRATPRARVRPSLRRHPAHRARRAGDHHAERPADATRARRRRLGRRRRPEPGVDCREAE